MLVVVAAAPLAFFARSLLGEFLYWDDYYNLVDNPYIRSFSWENVRWMLRTFHNRIYEPLSWLAKAAEYQLWGMRAWGYHAYSLLLHALNGVLVYVIALRLFQGARQRPAETPVSGDRQGTGADAHRPARGLVLGAGLAALLFALHPLRAECVALISAQPHLQASTLCLLSIWAYLRHAARRPGVSTEEFPIWSLVLYALSLLSKATAIGLPLALLVIDVYPLRRWRVGARRAVLREKVPFAALALLAALVATLARTEQYTGAGLSAFGLWPRIAQACYSTLFHVFKTLWPSDLAPVYVMLDGFDPCRGQFVIGVILVGGLTVGGFLLRRRVPSLWSAWLFYLVMLAPFMGLTDSPHYPVDRYTYLPMLGLSLLVGAAVRACWQVARSRWLAVALTAGLFMVSGILGALSWRQTRIWNNSVVLMEHVLEQVGDYPRRSWMIRLLARALAAEERTDEALSLYREAVEIDPENRDAHWEMGVLAGRMGLKDESIAAHRKAQRLDPDHREINLNLGAALVSAGRYAEAIPYFERVTETNPTDHAGYLGLAGTLSRAGLYAESLVVLERGLKQCGGHAQLAMRLAWLLATCPESELRDGQRALRIMEGLDGAKKDEDPRILDVLAAAYAEVRRYEEAVAAAERAVERCTALQLGEFCAALRARLALYRQNQPYREAGRAPSPHVN